MTVQPPKRQKLSVNHNSGNPSSGACPPPNSDMAGRRSPTNPQTKVCTDVNDYSYEFNYPVASAQDDQDVGEDANTPVEEDVTETTEVIDLSHDDYLVMEEQSGEIVYSGQLHPEANNGECYDGNGDGSGFFPTSDVSDEESGADALSSRYDVPGNYVFNEEDYAAMGLDAVDHLVSRKKTKKCSHDFLTDVEIGAGLQNLGNTCFFNTTLQCLTYTKPLLRYLMSSRSTKNGCRVNGVCLMCELGVHMWLCLSKSGEIVFPNTMLKKLKMVARHMRWGHQEDAHEFLRFLVEKLHNSCISGHQHIEDSIADQTKPLSYGSVINDMFTGYLRSQVVCLECGWRSNTFDPFLDLSLDVRNSNTLKQALARFVLPETLDCLNAYKCGKCDVKVRAEKRLTVHRLPPVLNIQLKRYCLLYGKVTRHIGFPEHLDMSPYVSANVSTLTNTSSGDTQSDPILLDDDISTTPPKSDRRHSNSFTAEGFEAAWGDEMPPDIPLTKRFVSSDEYCRGAVKGGSSSTCVVVDSEVEVDLKDIVKNEFTIPASVEKSPGDETTNGEASCSWNGCDGEDLTASQQTCCEPSIEPTLDTGEMKYTLYAVLVHEGQSTNSGHYFCYVRSLSGNEWYCLNDDKVHRATLKQVLDAEAYLLFYTRDGDEAKNLGESIPSCSVAEHNNSRKLDSSHARSCDLDRLSPRVDMCRGGHSDCTMRNHHTQPNTPRGATCRGGQKYTNDNADTQSPIPEEVCRGGQTSKDQTFQFKSENNRAFKSPRFKSDRAKKSSSVNNASRNILRKTVVTGHARTFVTKCKLYTGATSLESTAARAKKSSLVNKLKLKCRLSSSNVNSNNRSTRGLFVTSKKSLLKRRKVNLDGRPKSSPMAISAAIVSNSLNPDEILSSCITSATISHETICVEVLSCEIEKENSRLDSPIITGIRHEVNGTGLNDSSHPDILTDLTSIEGITSEDNLHSGGLQPLNAHGAINTLDTRSLTAEDAPLSTSTGGASVNTCAAGPSSDGFAETVNLLNNLSACRTISENDLSIDNSPPLADLVRTSPSCSLNSSRISTKTVTNPTVVKYHSHAPACSLNSELNDALSSSSLQSLELRSAEIRAEIENLARRDRHSSIGTDDCRNGARKKKRRRTGDDLCASSQCAPVPSDSELVDSLRALYAMSRRDIPYDVDKIDRTTTTLASPPLKMKFKKISVNDSGTKSYEIVRRDS